MSTAILISGQLRTFAQCYPTQRWHLLRHFAEPHFFICVQAQPDWAEILAPLMADHPGRVHVELKGDPDLSAHITPQITAAYHIAPYANAAPAHQLLLQHWYSWQSYEFFKTSSKNLRRRTVDTDTPVCFDTVIRLRADMYFHSFAPSGPARVPFFNACYTPWWGGFGGANDRVAIMGHEAAGAYFNVWQKIPELIARGCPFHPESLLAATLELEHVEHHRTLAAEFSTLRPDNKLRHWTTEIIPSEMRRAV